MIEANGTQWSDIIPAHERLPQPGEFVAMVMFGVKTGVKYERRSWVVCGDAPGRVKAKDGEHLPEQCANMFYRIRKPRGSYVLDLIADGNARPAALEAELRPPDRDWET